MSQTVFAMEPDFIFGLHSKVDKITGKRFQHISFVFYGYQNGVVISRSRRNVQDKDSGAESVSAQEKLVTYKESFSLSINRLK